MNFNKLEIKELCKYNRGWTKSFYSESTNSKFEGTWQVPKKGFTLELISQDKDSVNERLNDNQAMI